MLANEELKLARPVAHRGDPSLVIGLAVGGSGDSDARTLSHAPPGGRMHDGFEHQVSVDQVAAQRRFFADPRQRAEEQYRRAHPAG